LSWIEAQAQAFGLAVRAGHWAELFGNWLVIGGLSIAILLWAIIAAIRMHGGVRRFCRAIDDAKSGLAATPARAHEFAGSYEVVNASLQDAPIVGPAWRDWSATVITPDAAGTPVRSTNRPNTYFSLELLRYCRINPRLHAVMPNLLVGVGLLLTFAGLAIALSAAGGIADQSVSATARQSGLKNLLDVASAKFVTSLIGLLCSLGYTIFRGSELDKAERALDGFLAALEERIPLATSATLQAETNSLLEKSLTVQAQFATELAVNIGGRLDSALDQRLGEHIGPLREAIERLSDGIGTKSEDTLRSLLEQFRTMLQGSAESHMKELAGALAGTSNAMEQIRGGLADAASRMAGAADQIAEQMGRNAEQAMARITQQMEGLVNELRTLAEQSRAASDDATKAMADRIGQAAAGFERSAAQVAEALTSGAGDAAGRLTAAVEELRDHFVRLSGDLAGNLTTAGSQFAQQGRDGAAALGEAAQAAAEALRSGGEASGNSLRTGGADASHGLQAAAGELATPLRELGQRIASLQTEALELGKSLSAMRVGAIEATTPLLGATADLAKLAQSGQKTAADLALASQRIAPLADAVSAAMRQLEEAERRLGALSENLTNALGGFKDLDASLGKVFADLREGLGGFAAQVTRFVTEANKEMAQAVNTLNGAVTELAEVYQDTGPRRAAD
jgi:hypothetical protein